MVPVHQPSSAEPSWTSVFGFSPEQTEIEGIATLYETLPKTMMTLFFTVSGGLEWRVSAAPLVKMSLYYAVIWTAYVAFMVFGLLNVLTGIFVESAMSAVNNDRDNLIQTHLDERESLIETITAVFINSDTEGSGQITEKEMDGILQSPELVAYFNAIGVDTTEAMGLFQLLDDDCSGTVSIDEFVTGFLRLKGTAKAVDMVTLMYENRKISKLIKAILRESWSMKKAIILLTEKCFVETGKVSF
jgi:hypothetical protein